MTRPSTITSYDLTSGNDFPDRDPKSWTFEGSFDGLRWNVLDTRSSQSFSGRGVTNPYTCSNSTPYLYYRLNVSDNLQGKGDSQLAEWRVGGTQPSGTVPATVSSVTASVSGTTATVTWPAASGASGYYVQRIADDGNGAIEFSTTSTSYSDSTLVAGTPYLYRVQPYNGTLRGFPSASSNRIVSAAASTSLKDLTAFSTYAPTDQYNLTGVEGITKLTDAAVGTKYLAYAATTWVQQRLAASSVVTQYTLTSGNDYVERDPLAWTLQGSNDGSSWTTLDTRTNQGFANRLQTRVFSANPSSLSFSYYRLNVTANHGAPYTQLAEWRLRGSSSTSLAAPAVPTGLAVSAASSYQLLLTWTDAAGQQNPEASYTIDRATNSAFSANLVSKTTGSGSTGYHPSSLSPATTYYFRVKSNNATGSSVWTSTVNYTTPAVVTPPTSWVETGWYNHTRTLSRRDLDTDITLYVDQYVSPASSADWLRPILNQAFIYAKSAYGGFGDPMLYVVANQDNVAADVNDYYGGGGVVCLQDSPNYKNIIHVTSGDWTDQTSTWNIDAFTHELGHVVETTTNGVFGSPSYHAWGDSKWAEIFQYDIYLHSTLVPSGYAAAFYNEHLTSTDDWGNFWFRDFLYPLYMGNFGNPATDKKGAAVYSKYYQLLAQYLPKRISHMFAGEISVGEFLHFMSGAAGVSLESYARTAFKWTPELELQFANAQIMYPEVLALYSGSSCTAETDAAFCTRLGATCGSKTAADNCGTSRTVSSCGTCTSPQTCGGGGTANVCGSSGSSTPCTGLCSSPTVFTTQSYNSGNLGTAATCHQTTTSPVGLTCGNFASGRTFSINGTTINCASPTLPAKRNGGYCFQTSAGDYAWAYFSTW
ncbi:MAG: fibronectin type III domain-containing protein [Polyangiaceae bacterium]